jgi:hypothetical protein
MRLQLDPISDHASICRWKGSRPKAYVQSGETFTLEMATHLSGDAPELMIDGDPALEEIYKWVGPAPWSMLC